MIQLDEPRDFQAAARVEMARAYYAAAAALGVGGLHPGFRDRTPRVPRAPFRPNYLGWDGEG